MNKFINFIKRNKSIFIYSIIIIALYVYYVTAYAYKYASFNSDNVSPLLMAQDILNGNLLLKDWYGSTGGFLVNIYTYLLLPFSIFGMNYNLYYYYPPVIMVLIMVGAYLLVYRDRTYQNMSYINIFLIVILLVIPFTSLGMSFIYPSYHNETYAVILFLLLLVDKIKTLQNKKWYYPSLFILTFIATSDSYTVFIFVIPMLFLLLYRLICLNVRKKTELLISITILLSTFFVKIVEKNIHLLGGITYSSQVMQFAEKEQIFQRLGDIFNGMVVITDSYFFGLSVETAIFPLLSFSILIFMLCILVYGVINFNKYDIVTQFLISAPIIIFGIYLFSNIYIGPGAERYYVIIVLYLILLVSRIGIFDIISRFLEKNNIKHKYIQFLIVIILLSNAIHNIEKPIKKPIHNENPVVSFLLEKNLTNGYATFWNANVMSLYSNNKIKISALANNSPYYWLTKKTWYNAPANFILVGEKELEYYRDIFNDYSDIYQFHNIQFGIKGNRNIYVLKFDYDISKYFSDNSLLNYHCNNCDINKDRIILQKGGVQYGPYKTLDKGKYKITIAGENLDKVTFDTYSGIGNKQYELYDIKVENNLIEYYIELQERTNNIEHRIFNNQELQVKITSIIRNKI